LSSLLLTDNWKSRYDRHLLSSNKEVCSRIEFSFYGDILKNPSIYKDIIRGFFPRNSKYLSTYKCFYQLNVEYYYKKLFEGEKKYGRVIFIKEMANGKFKLLFCRFINQVSKSSNKPIGFEVIDSKENIYKIMLQSVTDFTISNSTSTIYYQKKNG
jgi:hypothetical protein